MTTSVKTNVKNDDAISAFRLRPSPAPWGDYGDILMHGMSRHLPRKGGRIQLERTAPFVPSITFPGGSVVVTNAARLKFEQSGLVGFQFIPVDLARTVELDWHNWDRNAEKPRLYPANGEPSSYILERPHDPDAASRIGQLWELVPQVWGVGKAERITRSALAYYISITQLGPAPMPNFFRVEGSQFPLVSSAARDFLEREFGDLLRFEAAGIGTN